MHLSFGGAEIAAATITPHVGVLRAPQPLR